MKGEGGGFLLFPELFSYFCHHFFKKNQVEQKKRFSIQGLKEKGDSKKVGKFHSLLDKKHLRKDRSLDGH